MVDGTLWGMLNLYHKDGKKERILVCLLPTQDFSCRKERVHFENTLIQEFVPKRDLPHNSAVNKYIFINIVLMLYIDLFSVS